MTAPWTRAYIDALQLMTSVASDLVDACPCMRVNLRGVLGALAEPVIIGIHPSCRYYRA